MDTDKVLKRLSDFLALLDHSQKLHHRYWDQQQKGVIDLLEEANERVLREIPAIRRIAREVNPEYEVVLTKPVSSNYEWDWVNVKSAALQIIGYLQSEAELSEMLGPTGPQLSASGIHAWVWDAAANLWADGHRREAVRAAAEMISLQLQAKLDRNDISGADLATQAFNKVDPTPGSPRLRFSGLVPGTPAFIAAHEGAMFFGKGCFMAIRNPATHTLDSLDEQQGLEFLASLSVLARWIEAAVVVR